MCHDEVEKRLAECGRLMVIMGAEFRRSIVKAVREWAESS